MPSAYSSHRALKLEALEERILLSCGADFSDGILTITCDDEDDSITVTTDIDGLFLLNLETIDGNPSTGNTDGIVLLPGKGNDVITLDQNNVALGPGAEEESSGKSEIEITLVGGAGKDLLLLRGHNNSSNSIKISQNKININGDNDGDLSLLEIESIEFYGGNNSDVICLANCTEENTQDIGLERVLIDGGDGADLMRNGIILESTLRGGNGNDTLFGSERAEEI